MSSSSSSSSPLQDLNRDLRLFQLRNVPNAHKNLAQDYERSEHEESGRRYVNIEINTRAIFYEDIKNTNLERLLVQLPNIKEEINTRKRVLRTEKKSLKRDLKSLKKQFSPLIKESLEQYASCEKELLESANEEIKDEIIPHHVLTEEDLQSDAFGYISQMLPTDIKELPLDNEEICAQILRRQEEIEKEIDFAKQTKLQSREETSKLEKEWNTKLQVIQRQHKYESILIGKHDEYYSWEKDQNNSVGNENERNANGANSTHWNHAETNRAQMNLKILQQLCDIEQDITLNPQGFIAQMQCEDAIYNVCIETGNKGIQQVRNVTVEAQENDNGVIDTAFLDDIISNAIASQKKKRWSVVAQPSLIEENKKEWEHNTLNDIDTDETREICMDDLMSDKMPIQTTELVHKISNRLRCLSVRTKELENLQQFYECCWEKSSEALVLVLNFVHHIKEPLLDTYQRQSFQSYDQELNVEITCLLDVSFDYCPEWSEKMVKIQEIEHKFQECMINEPTKEQIGKHWIQICQNIKTNGVQIGDGKSMVEFADAIVKKFHEIPNIHCAGKKRQCDFCVRY